MQEQHEPSPRGSGRSTRGRAQLDKHISHLRLCHVCYHPLAVESHMTKQTPSQGVEGHSADREVMASIWVHGATMGP